MQQLSPIIHPNNITQILDSPGVVIVDARSGADAHHRYLQGHIKGALHVDLDRDLSTPTSNPAIGGRHPLPDPKKFASLLQHLGIGTDTHVLIYDDKNGANAAARFWWMLKAAGHTRQQVIDGGWQAAQRAGLPISKEDGLAKPNTAYRIDKWILPIATIQQVEKVNADPEYLIIDVREAYRYRGEKEPIDLIAGHIPRAVNSPYIDNLDSEGYFLSPEQLKTKYDDLLGARDKHNVIVHCGSGVTACHTILAMEYAGISGAKLYVGSWSEWSRSGKPIAKEI